MEYLTLSRAELESEFGEGPIKTLKAILASQHTKERELELMRNSTVGIIYKDYIAIQFKPEYFWYLGILANWWIGDDNRVKAEITHVTFYDNQEEMDDAKSKDAMKSIKLNEN